MPKGLLKFSWLFIACLTFVSFRGKGQTLVIKDSIFLVQQDSIAQSHYLSKPELSIRIATQTLQSAIEARSKYLEGLSYYILSKANWTKSNYYLSTEYGFKALKIFENTQYIEEWGESLLSLARTSIDLQNYDQAKKFLVQATRLSRDQKNEALLAQAFRETSMLLLDLKKYDSAQYYADAGLVLFEKFNDSLNASILYSRKAKIYFFKKDYNKSKYYNAKSLLYDSLVGNRRALGLSYYQSALNIIHLHDLDSAVILLKESSRILNEIGNIMLLIKVHNLMANIYVDQKKPELAVSQLRLVSQYKDSLYNLKKSEQIQEMQSLYELSSKERTIQKLEHENSLRQHQVNDQRKFLGLLSLFIIVLVVLVFVLIRLRRIQTRTNADLAAKNDAIQYQKEEIQAQANSLRQLSQLKSKLFSVISHDLRGPIGNLHGLLDLLTRKKLSPEEFMALSDTIKRNLNLTQRTLDNLLNWSLSQMEGIKTEPKTINVKSMVDEACHLMNELAQRKNIVLENNSEEVIYVQADADQLQLVLRNLIHNAIKFSKPRDKVLISTFKHSDFCKISVHDFGIGMTESEIETITNSGDYFSKVGTQQEKGTGLGLLLCKEFIKRNGGSLRIESHVDQGTEVAFTLPIA